MDPKSWAFLCLALTHASVQLFLGSLETEQGVSWPFRIPILKYFDRVATGDGLQVSWIILVAPCRTAWLKGAGTSCEPHQNSRCG